MLWSLNLSSCAICSLLLNFYHFQWQLNVAAGAGCIAAFTASRYAMLLRAAQRMRRSFDKSARLKNDDQFAGSAFPKVKGERSLLLLFIFMEGTRRWRPAGIVNYCRRVCKWRVAAA
jgi:hypothetical protein